MFLYCLCLPSTDFFFFRRAWLKTASYIKCHKQHRVTMNPKSSGPSELLDPFDQVSPQNPNLPHKRFL